MKTSRVLILSLAAFVFFFALQGLSLAAEIGEISNIQGKVEKTRQGRTEAQPVKIGEPVVEGDIIRTRADGKAEIKFNDGSVVRLAPNTRLNVTQYMSKDDAGSGKKRILRLLAGKISAEVGVARKWIATALGDAERFEVHTPTAVVGVKGTRFFTYYINGISGVYVMSGSVDMHNPRIPYVVTTLGEGDVSVIADPNKPPRPPARGIKAEFLRHLDETTIETEAGKTSGLELDGVLFGYSGPESDAEGGDVFSDMEVLYPQACL